MPTAIKQPPINPYVTGGPVGNHPAFVGREDVQKEVLRVLDHSQNNAVVLFGQRRIGKTSVLRELEAKLPKHYIPVYFDLQDKAAWSLGRLLQELASTIRDVLQKNRPNKGQLDLGSNPETTFYDCWLPQVLDKLPQSKSLVLLFDEFDVLDGPNTTPQAGKDFFPYLRTHLLPLNKKRLNFVFVIGRKIDDMTHIALSVLKLTTTKRVSLLSHEDVIKLVRLSEDNQTLQWNAEAAEKIWQLTSGHPYLTQVLCSYVWYKLWDNASASLPKVTAEDIQGNIVDEAIEASGSALEWLWEGLPPAERVVASALAEAGNRNITDKQLEDLLTQSGVKVVIRELQTAPHLLQDWDLIEGVTKDGYRFRVELLRRWIAKHKPLGKVREELDRIEPVADSLYQAGLGSYRAGNLDDALTFLRQADRLNPNHLAANQLLAEILLAQNQPNEGREVLERLYLYQPDVTRPRLIQALLESAKASKVEDEQVKLYKRVLDLEVNHVEASRQLLEISLAKGQIKQASDLLLKLYEIQPNETMDWVTNEPRRKEAISLLLLGNFANHEQNVQSVSGNGIVKKILSEVIESKLSINRNLLTDNFANQRLVDLEREVFGKVRKSEEKKENVFENDLITGFSKQGHDIANTIEKMCKDGSLERDGFFISSTHKGRTKYL